MKKPRKLTPPTQHTYKAWLPPFYLCCDQVTDVTFIIAENFTYHVKLTCARHRDHFIENRAVRSRYTIHFESTKKLQHKIERSLRLNQADDSRQADSAPGDGDGVADIHGRHPGVATEVAQAKLGI